MYDIVIVGGGVIGCAISRLLLVREPQLKVCLLEKEKDLALHQSGRNSGVVHVGYNQKPGTLKARLVVEGSQRLRDFCRKRRVPLVEDGILVVARNDVEMETIGVLCQRGKANGADVELIGKEELREREPYSAGVGALWAPAGASFDSRTYVQALAEEAQNVGSLEIIFETVQGLVEEASHVEIRTDNQRIRARVLVNAAGLHADRLAKQLGKSQDYQIIPFRGYYSELTPEKSYLVRSHLYACPNLQFPFLGVHLSRNFDGRVRVGPGAVLALGREAYQPFQMQFQDCLRMLNYEGFWRMAFSSAFLRLMREEWRKSLFRSAVAAEARLLTPALRNSDLRPSISGIRAQLVDRQGRMVDDLVVEETPQSVHVLNAVSPALTCSLPFADLVVERVLARV